jgi:hypothetical protein
MSSLKIWKSLKVKGQLLAQRGQHRGKSPISSHWREVRVDTVIGGKIIPALAGNTLFVQSVATLFAELFTTRIKKILILQVIFMRLSERIRQTGSALAALRFHSTNIWERDNMFAV